MSKMSERDLLNQMNLPLNLKMIPEGPTTEELGQVVRVLSPEPEPKHRYEPYSPEFCPNCGSRNWECFEEWDYECYDCGKLFSEYEGGDE